MGITCRVSILSPPLRIIRRVSIRQITSFGVIFDAPKLNYPLVNSSDFSAMVLNRPIQKVSPYYALLTEVLKKASVDKRP